MSILNIADETQRSFLSIPAHTQINSTPSLQGSVLGLNIPSSSVGAGAEGVYQLPIHDVFKGDDGLVPNNVIGNGGGLFDDEEQILFDDSTFEFDADGNFRDISVPVSAPPSGPREAGIGRDGLSGKDINHEKEAKAQARPLATEDEGYCNMPPDYDDIELLPEAEPFMTGALRGTGAPASDTSFTIQESSESAEAPARRRPQKRTKKRTPTDQECHVPRSTLLEWQENYIENMLKVKKARLSNRQRAQAKKNAYEFVFGRGINGVGRGHGSEKIPGPLYMFSADKLMVDILGTPAGATGKHPRDDGDDGDSGASDDGEARRVRRRQDHDEEIGRGAGYYEDEIMMDVGLEDSGEVGRDAPPALQDYPSSSMPWNVSASINSYSRGRSSSAVARGVPNSQLGSQHGSIRLPSASPLIGRGSVLPVDLITYGRDEEEDRTILDEAEDAILRGTTVNHPFTLLSSNRSAGSTGFPPLNDDDVFGPAINIDSHQGVAPSQLVKARDAIEGEAGNFFDFLCNSIFEQQTRLRRDQERSEDLYSAEDVDDAEGELSSKKWISFHTLFDPRDHTPVVAAQAFYHVLTLATKRALWVEQDVPAGQQGEPMPFGEIRIGISP